MTGRAAGFCAGYNVPGYANPIPGRGRGMGGGRGCGFFGGGRGRRNRYFATGLTGWQRAAMAEPMPAPAPSREQQVEALKAQEAELANMLNDIRRQLDSLKPAEDEKATE